MSYTKGPWHLHKKESTTGFRIDSAGNEWQWLAEVFQAPGFEDEGEANARLISAAPEMYEIIKAMHNPDCDGTHCRFCVIIKKVEGK